MSETRRKYTFICLDEECMKDTGPCMIEVWGEVAHEPDYPSWCPWEFQPTDLKYKAWRLLK